MSYGFKSYLKVVLAMLLSAVATHAVAAGNTLKATSKTSAKSTSPIVKKGPISDLDFSFRLGHDSLRSTSQTVEQTKTLLEMNLFFAPTEIVQIKLQPMLYFQSGYLRSLDADSGEKNTLRLKETSIQLFGNSTLSAQAGVLNESQKISPILLGGSSFPAVQMNVGSANRLKEKNQWSLFAQYAIPTSTSLSAETANEEQSPSLQTVGFATQYANARLKTSFKLAGFQFQNLPTRVAQESDLLGNSVESENNSQHRFQYEYKGILAGAEASYLMNSYVYPVVSVDYVKNTQAPAGLSEAYKASLGNTFTINKDHSLQLFGSLMRIESDAVVAKYTDAFSQSNTLGYELGAKWSISKILSIESTFGEQTAIYERAFREKERTVGLKLETTYDAI